MKNTHKTIPALLLAAGLGTRLKPITDSIPKCLVPICGRPLLDIWIEKCFNFNMFPIIINLSYLPEKVEEYLNSSSLYKENKEKFILIYEKELKGTGGTLLSLENTLRGHTFFVAHADNLSIFSMEEFYKAHINRPSHCAITAMSFRTSSPETCGILELNNIGVVEQFHEKVKNLPSHIGNLANGAVYFMEDEVLDILKVSDKVPLDISIHLLPHYMGRIYTFYNDTYHRDIGNIESYTKAQEDMKNNFSSSFLYN